MRVSETSAWALQKSHMEFPEGPVSVLEKARRERLNREMAGSKALLNIFEIQIKFYLNQEMKTFKVPMESQDLPQGCNSFFNYNHKWVI